MRIRTSAILLLSLAAAACTAESTAPTAVPADARRDEAATDSAAAPDPGVPDSKGSVLPSVRTPPDSKGSVLPSI